MNDTWKTTTITHSAMSKREFVWLEAWKVTCMNTSIDFRHKQNLPKKMADSCLEAFDNLFRTEGE